MTVHPADLSSFSSQSERIQQARADWRQARFDTVPGDPFHFAAGNLTAFTLFSDVERRHDRDL